MRDCITNKIGYATEYDAKEALLHVRATYRSASGNLPGAYYRCDQCSCYHLTSKSTGDNNLIDRDTEKSISLRQEASYWEDKFNR